MANHKLLVAFVAVAVPLMAAAQDACMVPPTAKQEVSGRFGKFRGGGAANFGSGNSKPHMHDGLDFSTGGLARSVYSTTAGTVTWARLRGSAGNTVMIRRDNGEIVGYYHLSSIAVKEGQTVKAGQEIGFSGNTGMKPGGAVHLHFVYGVPNASDARAKSFSADAAKNPAFNPGQIPSALSKKDFGYTTDPSPYFCQTFPIQNDGLHPILGPDTKAQYAKLFGSTPTMGVPPTGANLEPVQVAAANGDALQAAAKGASNISSMLNDADGYGSLPSPPMGAYETMSPLEMMATEARRRFGDAEWNTSITKVSSRALWVDYVRAKGVAVYMEAALQAKRDRVEALMALYTSQVMAGKRNAVDRERLKAMSKAVSQSIQ
jgi:murein DD-endopeptidase